MDEIFWLAMILLEYALNLMLFLAGIAFKVGVFLFGLIVELAAANPKAVLITSLVGGGAVLLFVLLRVSGVLSL